MQFPENNEDVNLMTLQLHQWMRDKELDLVALDGSL